MVAGKSAAKTGARFIPFVGEVLLAGDVIFSTWNWLSSNQAPRYTDLKNNSWIKDNFNPSEVEIGRPLTICFSSSGTGWGDFFTGLLFNTDTRTTMELVKIGENSGSSIFIISQINSKSFQKQFSEYDLMMAAFSNSRKVERGYIDNDDLKFKIMGVQGLAEIVANVGSVFYGYCDWMQFISAHEKSSDVFLVSDERAPDEYSFNFKDTEDNVINVTGKKITSEQLSNMSDDQLICLFGIKEIEEMNESHDVRNHILNGGILNFNTFLEKSDGVFESGENDPNAASRPFTAKEKSTPAIVAPYDISKKEYANPELRNKQGYGVGKFTAFLLGEKGYSVDEDEKIKVAINSDELLLDTRYGIFEYVPEEPEEDESEDKRDDRDEREGDEVTRRKVSPLDREDEYSDDLRYYDRDPKSDSYQRTFKDDFEDGVKTSQGDVTFKNRRGSTVIKDNPVSGGVNIFDKFLSYREKEILGISDWKNISTAKEILDRAGNVIKIKMVNKYATFGDRRRIYSPQDGEPFEIARKFVEETKDRIKYQ